MSPSECCANSSQMEHAIESPSVKRQRATFCGSRAAPSRPAAATGGRTASSRNAIAGGVFAHAALLHGESAEDRQRELDAWSQTLRPGSPGEAALVARIVDVLAREDRLALAEHRVLDEGVEQALAATSAAKEHRALKEALLVLSGLASTFEGIDQELEYEELEGLMPSLRRTLEMVEKVDAPMAILLPFRGSLQAAMVESLLGASPETMREISRAARDLGAWCQESSMLLGKKMEEERERLYGDPLVADEASLRRLDQYRSRLRREMDCLIGRLRQVRELARAQDGEGGSFFVELTVLERPYLARR